jgi:acyl transferase domain-containing protein/aryl carrier-like protein
MKNLVSEKRTVSARRRIAAEPIAIVGMASRLPGAPSLDSFWNMLMRGGDAIGEEIPAHLRGSDWSDVRAALGNPAANRLGGFLDHIEDFDAGFFGLSPREAVRMSPVHRIMLETVWDALEDSGTPAEAIAGTRTGVFTSCLLNSEYWDLLVESGIHDIHGLLGAVMHGAASGRIAYALDLRGPNMAVDATCAGSLVAAHLACGSIRSGESEMAIVASVNLQLDALHTTALARGRVISPTGACRFGDRAADGYVRSDGAAAVLLKPLDAALDDGDRIYATILGSGSSSVGRGSSLVAPRASEQAAAIRAAHADAAVEPGDVDYIEAHGTGTAEGDRTELTALGEVLRGSRGVNEPCLVGSAKSNIGHTEAASGLVGVIKTALALWHRTIPRTVHVHNPNVLFTDPTLPLRLVDTHQPWPVQRNRTRRIAGVSSFGMSGVNVHMVLGDAPTPPPGETDRPASPGFFLLPVSGRAPQAVCELAQSYAKQVEGSVTLREDRDICFSVGARRSHHQHRIAIVGFDRTELADGLRAFAAGDLSAGNVVVGERPVRDAPRVAFVFPGQGGQWAGMGRELLATNAVFRRRLLECEDAVCDEAGWSLTARLAGGGPWRDAEVQPLLWAIQVSLAEVWRGWGLDPDVVVGHSMGEIAAATVSGALTLRDAAAVVCRRGALVGELPTPGGMVAVRLGEREVRAAIGEFADRVTVAVINSAHSTVLSGDADALAAVVDPLRERGVLCRPLRVGYASHGPQVDAIRERFVTALADVRPRRGQVPIHSTVVGRELDGSELDARYWMANLRRPVRFADAVDGILADGRNTLFVEIGPHPVLASAIEEALESPDAHGDVITSLRRDEPEARAMATSLARAYVLGCPIDWDQLNPGGKYVPLPGYPWQRTRYWVDRPTGTRPRQVRTVGHPTRFPVAAGLDVSGRFLTLLGDLLGTTAADVDTTAPLPLLGMDSLLAMTLRDRVRKDLGVELSVRDLLGTRSAAELAADLNRRMTTVR